MTGRTITDLALHAEPFNRIAGRLEAGGARLWVTGLLGSSKALLAAVLSRRFPHTWVVIAPTPSDAEHIHDDLVTFLGDERVQLFGEWETLPYERRSPLATITESRLVTLKRLLADEPIIVVTSPRAMMQATLPRRLLQRTIQTVRPGEDLDLGAFTRSLVDMGFRRVRIVEDSGDLSVRGGIVDVMPFGYDDPIRIELDGDRVASVRQFDVTTQRSLRDLDSATILPRREVVLVGEGVGELMERLAATHTGRLRGPRAPARRARRPVPLRRSRAVPPGHPPGRRDARGLPSGRRRRVHRPRGRGVGPGHADAARGRPHLLGPARGRPALRAREAVHAVRAGRGEAREGQAGRDRPRAERER